MREKDRKKEDLNEIISISEAIMSEVLENRKRIDIIGNIIYSMIREEDKPQNRKNVKVNLDE